MQAWTAIYEISAIPTLFVLLCILRSKSSDTSTSRNYYAAGLILLLVWTALDFTSATLPPDQTFLAATVTRLTFLIVSMVVYVFVTSAIYFTRRPRMLEILFVASPIIMILGAFIVDPFSVIYTNFGWQGDLMYPAMKYTWLILAVSVMVYSFVRLFRIRSRVQDRESKRRMTFFVSAHVVALIVAVALYLLPQTINSPVTSSVGVNLSILVAYPAFSPILHKTAA